MTVTATSNGQTVDDVFTVTVTAVDDPPVVANALSEVNATEDDADQTIALSNVFNDVVSYAEAIQKELRIMDMTAISLCKENSLPIKVFNINRRGDLKKLILGEPIGTLVGD
mgnify:CR=1 FL=1